MQTLLGKSIVLLAAAMAMATLHGCAGYQVGSRTLYRGDLRTVHVSIFTSGSLRRDIGEQLTEAVIREIETQTPYKVVGSADADSQLTGRVTTVDKRLLVESQNDDARAVEFDLIAQVNWVDRRGAVIMKDVVVPVSPLSLSVTTSGSFVPEGGQSLGTARQHAIDKAAAEIVSHMQMRW